MPTRRDSKSVKAGQSDCVPQCRQVQKPKFCKARKFAWKAEAAPEMKKARLL